MTPSDTRDLEAYRCACRYSIRGITLRGCARRGGKPARCSRTWKRKGSGQGSSQWGMARRSLGEAGNPARLSGRRDGRHVAAIEQRGLRPPFLRQGHLSAAPPYARGRDSNRARRLEHQARRVRRPRRGVHAADVRERRRARRRRDDDRLARARRIVCPGWRARAPERRGAARRSARAGECVAGGDRGRCGNRRQLRHLRRHGREEGVR